MTDYELAQIALSIGDQIDFLWNFYVTACAILLGWLFSSNISWDKDKQIALTVLFVIFAAVNLSAVYNSYTLFESALAQLRQSTVSNNFISEFANTTGIGSMAAIIVHLTADIFIYNIIKRLMYKKHSE